VRPPKPAGRVGKRRGWFRSTLGCLRGFPLSPRAQSPRPRQRHPAAARPTRQGSGPTPRTPRRRTGPLSARGRIEVDRVFGLHGVARMVKAHLPNVLTYSLTRSRAPPTKPSTASFRPSSSERTASAASPTFEPPFSFTAASCNSIRQPSDPSSYAVRANPEPPETQKSFLDPGGSGSSRSTLFGTPPWPSAYREQRDGSSRSEWERRS
jgi:hypothetical protein